jgi:alpha-mannosidase
MKKILLNQFHDVLPGSAIREVYEDADALYAEAFRTGEKLCGDAVNTIVQNRNTQVFTVFNPYAEEVSGYVSIDGAHYYAEAVPAKGYKVCRLGEAAPKVPVTFSNNTVESEYYAIRISDFGEISELYDKKA